ncbi:MAG: flagellin [Anaerolineales bacterium]|nr:flagellin [Anaerolineales bacterium]
MAGTVDPTRIAGNIGALNALNSLQYINENLALHQTRLATGKRINYAFEDPAGLNLATTFDVRRKGLEVVLRAIGDSRSLMSTAEGGLRKIQDIMIKLRAKTMEAVGDTIGVNERAAVQAQMDDYVAEIDQIVSQTQWNGVPLLSGSSATAPTGVLHFLVDPDGGSVGFEFTNNQSFFATNLDSALVSGSASLSVATSDLAVQLSQKIDAALRKVMTGVMDVGAFTARLTFKEDTLRVQYINTESAYNRIMNANMAEEQVEASKFMILQQTATAMLAQANLAPQFLLALFR